jgi:hypothetical protein
MDALVSLYRGIISGLQEKLMRDEGLLLKLLNSGKIMAKNTYLYTKKTNLKKIDFPSFFLRHIG